MTELFIMRHADALSAQDGQKDFDRPLSAIGKMRAQAIGRYLHTNGCNVGIALVSPSRRTLQTYDAMREVDDSLPEHDAQSEIYNAESSVLLRLIQATVLKTKAVLLIGHNPGVHQLAIELCATPQRINDFRPATLCGLKFESFQSTGEIQNGTLTHFFCS